VLLASVEKAGFAACVLETPAAAADSINDGNWRRSHVMIYALYLVGL
jgi:hypothetical protein